MGKSRKPVDVECFACGVLCAEGSYELAHFPVPSGSGGEETVPLCKPCHDMADRIPLQDWPIDWVAEVCCTESRAVKLLMFKALRICYEAMKVPNSP